MLSQPVLAAVSDLQRRAIKAVDLFEIERIERALDEILRHPTSTKPASTQIYSSRGHASQSLTERRRILGGAIVALVVESDDKEEYDARVVRAVTTIEPGFAEVEFEQWLATTTSVTDRDRSFLRALAVGEDAASLAAVHGSPATIMSQRLSRVRRRGRTAYHAEMRSA